MKKMAICYQIQGRELCILLPHVPIKVVLEKPQPDPWFHVLKPDPTPWKDWIKDDLLTDDLKDDLTTLAVIETLSQTLSPNLKASIGREIEASIGHLKLPEGVTIRFGEF